MHLQDELPTKIAKQAKYSYLVAALALSVSIAPLLHKDYIQDFSTSKIPTKSKCEHFT
jgi:hypothetical protein